MSIELTFCLHDGYYVARETMIELYAQFRPGKKIEDDFLGNAFILSPDDLTQEEEVWLLSDNNRYVITYYLLTSLPDRDERRILERHAIPWCHARKPGITRIDRPELFVLLSQLEREQPPHNYPQRKEHYTHGTVPQ